MKKRSFVLTAILSISMLSTLSLTSCTDNFSTSSNPNNSSDIIGSNVSTTPSVVAVSLVELAADKTELEVGDSIMLTTTVLPSNATDKSVTYKSSDDSVITVSQAGLVTAKALGKATITVTTNDGKKTDTLDFEVITASILEAENAILTAGASGEILINNTEGASGGKTLGNCFNNTGANITFTVVSEKAASYNLYACIGFGSTHTDDPLSKVVVNGEDVEVPKSFDDPQANWNHFMEFYLATVELNAGENTISLVIDKGLGNVDYVKFTGQGKLTSPKEEASITISTALDKYLVGVKSALNITSIGLEEEITVTSSDKSVIDTATFDTDTNQVLFTPLKAGKTTIKLVSGEAEASAEINVVEASGDEYTFKGVDADLSAGYGIDDPNADGQVVGGIWDNHAKISYLIESKTEQTVSLIFRTAIFDATRTKLTNTFEYIKVNDVDLALENVYIEASSGLGTSNYGFFYFTDVKLNAGNNTIVLQTTTTGRTNFDYMLIKSTDSVDWGEEEVIPPETGEKYRFEGELATLEGCNSESQALASGGYCVGGISDSSVITYQLNSLTEQVVDLALITAVVSTDRIKVGDYYKQVTINDTPLTLDSEATIEYTGSPTWTCFAPVTIEDVSLQKGINTLKISLNGSTCFDYIEINAENYVGWNYDEAVESKLEGDEAILTSCYAATEEDGASGGKHVGGISTGSMIEFDVTSAASQFVTLNLKSAIVGADRLSFASNIKEITVNDVVLKVDGEKEFIGSTDYGWGNYCDFEIRDVRLNEGDNKIIIKFADGAMTNFDYLLIKGAAEVEFVKEEEEEITEIEGTSYYYEPAAGTKDLGEYAGARNGDAIGFVNYNGFSMTIKVMSAEAKKVSAYINTAYSDGNSPVTSLKVNGVEATELVKTINVNSNWDAFERNFIGNLDLIAGENTIEIVIGTNCGKFDYLELVSPVELLTID